MRLSIPSTPVTPERDRFQRHGVTVVESPFPASAPRELTSIDRCAAESALLRRAIAFIEANIGRDIALTDVAAAVFITPRALQYTFRRHLNTSPMEYVRKVRIDQAHRQLLAADPATTTVQTVATQWGFAHTGRFSALYRRTYGRNPSDTLRS
ncbi:hypothetical protein MKUB_24170 [Mycobacterium kubicae]|uniref:Helix-turn-helix transcriptional regulator n=1 Tax=Mycobacterium kubicae TaxID=120959 RepID=A0AAX1JF98_9MYCO|nr:helix-turn-helix transcriptional regulator [Mycobacterium kubicae]QNI06972.1 helix-turn-helix transcriptional regulator [Mycobacterium kubicae]QNI11978.1 helix-turn-helix transcriptional regulator [Mycobacterium kubicae]QPI40203.1 helix-turn-helix transcriptional regulator [Mycobacterium kubicae]GFG64927.1 hypothetical protein MKUB_24170 [Mycobacterium kubicae]